ncbi:MAG TPA: acyloxyacyl hydrolase [Terracidiphilus sp.]|nr:acyloxyacyl hydrolase [Terracidiphilus sp.]
MKFFLLLLMGGSVLGFGTAQAAAQAGGVPASQNVVGAVVSDSAAGTQVASDSQTTKQRPPDSPVTEVRDERGWEMGPFINWGTGLGNRDQFKFLSAGFELGKTLTPVIHAGIVSGQFQFAGNIMPLWQAYTPAPHEQLYSCLDPQGHPVPCTLPTGGGTFYGVSLTPVILRWNLSTHSRRWQPWFQGAGGLIYTTHKFPPNILSDPALGINGGTSVWNFSPQGGAGVHYFLRDKRSIDLGVNAVHISSSSLGDRNPGVNALIQIQVGYTFWK